MMAEREYACFACGRPCDPDPHGPPWCGRCSGMADAEELLDKAELAEGDLSQHRMVRLRRAGRVPDANVRRS